MPNDPMDNAAALGVGRHRVEDRHLECIKDVFRDNVRLRRENERLRNAVHWFESEHGIDDDRVREFYALLGRAN